MQEKAALRLWLGVVDYRLRYSKRAQNEEEK